MTVKIDTTKLDAKLERLRKALKKAGTETIIDITEKGKLFAKLKAPHYTGKTADYIIARKNPALGQGTIVARNPTANDGHQRNIANFHLVRWMHTSSKAQRHIKSGDRRFMYRTAEYLVQIKKGVASGHFDKVNIK